MTILVADDDPVARKVLSTFLRQSNYDVVVAEDGLSALRVMTEPGAPQIAVLDWMMPGLSGPELCTKLRQHTFEIQPYLLILTSRKEKSDLAAALDAGADDFISKPFNILELQARLRLAMRHLQQQTELRNRIAELERQLAAGRGQPAQPAAEAAPAAPEISEPARPTGVAALEKHQIDTVVAGAMRHCGEPNMPFRMAQGNPQARVVAWASLLLTKEQQWLDMFLEVDDASRRQLCSNFGYEQPDRDAARSICSRMQLSLRESLRSVLQAMGGEVMAPLPVHALGYPERLNPLLTEEPALRHHYKLGSAIVTVTFVTHASPRLEKAAGQLRPFDLLAEAYPPATTHQVPLLHAGVVLKENLIEKLREFSELTVGEVPAVPVHSPSPLSRHFIRLSASVGLAI